MAYNLNSLVTVLQKILDPKQTYWIFDHNKPQLQFLLEKATSLKKILENCSTTNLKGLESQIRDAAHEAEYTIKSHIADQILLRPGLAKYNFSTPNLHQIVQDLDSAMEQVTKLMDGKKTISSASTSSFSPDSSSRSVAVEGSADRNSKMYFPDTNNGSRIVLTTRGSDVAKHVDPQSPQHEVQLLNKLESWNLLYQKVFGEEDCPIVLQEIGRTWCVGLPFLLLESLNLVRWTAVETNFPGLRRLIIRDCSVLEEIPSGIGEIMTLQLIELEKCSPTAVESAKEIREVQYDYGNYELQLRIIS